MYLQMSSYKKWLITVLCHAGSSSLPNLDLPTLESLLVHCSPISESVCFSCSAATYFLLTNLLCLKGNCQTSVLNLLSQDLHPSDCQATPESFISELPQAPSFQLCSPCPRLFMSESWGILTCGFHSSQSGAAVAFILLPPCRVHGYWLSVRETEVL